MPASFSEHRSPHGDRVHARAVGDAAGAAHLLREAAGSGHRRRAHRIARGGRGAAPHLEADVRRRLGRHRLAQGVRRPGRSAIEQFIFFDESMRAGAPVPMLTLNTVGPTIMAFGTDEQKADYLPRILSGDIHFCIGYSEPGAGTDLASLKTRAVHDGDSYVINGQKMWTSLVERRRLLLARGAHRPRRREAQGHLDDHRADGHARHHDVATEPARQPRHQRGVLRGRRRPRRQRRRR